MVAGIRPSRVSVSPNWASLVAIATSHTQAIPTPPPKAPLWMRPIKGSGISFRARSIKASFRASTILVSRSASICCFIQPRSPPAQNTLPRPDMTTTRAPSRSSTVSAKWVSSEIICADSALRLSGRFSSSETTPRASCDMASV